MSLFKIRLNPDDYYSKEEQEQIRKEVKEKYKEGKGKAKFLLDETLKSFDLEEQYSSKTSEEKKKEMAKAMIEYDEMFDEKRNEKYEGGILGDDRARYAEGPKDKVKKEDSFLGHLPMISDEIKQKVLEGDEDAKNYIAREYNMDMDALEMEINKFQEDRKNLSHGGGPLPNEGLEELHKEEPDLVAKMLRDGKAEGGDVDNQMSKLLNDLKEEQENLIPEPQMESDEEMEDNYMDFILDEALTEEEEDMLMSKLEQDEQLSMLFDKVVEVASEFAGSGPVEGPGTGVSDSIPARLSDGEFVFTAKAVEEIGADELMRMMKDAEMRADERQGMANGGEMDEETVVVKGDDEPARQEIRVVKETVDSAGRMVQDEDEISKNIKSNMMLDPNQQHVRS